MELSHEAQEPLDDLQVRDAILLKMTMEGKDFHTARQEVLAQREARPAAPAAVEDPEAGGSSVQVELTAVRVIHVEGEITAPGAHLTFEATRVDLVHAGLSGSKQDPLVIDLDGSGPRTSGRQGAQDFDLLGDGERMPTSFVSGNTAFLALDRDRNGRIDSGRELFGDQHGAADGYEELRKFDSDGNGRIDALDPVYGDLSLLFADQRQLALSAAGIRSLRLDADGPGYGTASGDEVLRTATAETADGGVLRTYAMGLQRFEASA